MSPEPDWEYSDYMDAHPAVLRRLSCRLHDLDRVEAFWKNDLKARVVFDEPRPGPEPFRFDSVAVGDISTGLLRPNIGYTVHDSPAESYVVSLTSEGGTWHEQGGVRYPSAPGHALTYRPGLGPRVTSVGVGSETTYLRVEPWVMERHLETMLDRPVTGPIALAPRTVLRPDASQTWWELLQLFNRLLLAGDNPLSRPAVLHPLREALLSCLLLSVDHQYRDALARPAPPCRPRHVRRAVDAIHAHPEQPYTVATLAGLAGVSVRTLQEGFRVYLQASPMGYLRQVRLSRAHDDLASNATLHVAEVAYRWGFAHLGRFAAAYAKRYGELPSQPRNHGCPG